jgi:hypothetical protein
VRKIIVLSIVLVGLLALSAQGTVVFSQPYDQVNAYFSDPWWPQFIADDFQIPGDTTITDVHWWGVYNGFTPQFDDFTISFYQVTGGTIGSLIQTNTVGSNYVRTDTGVMVADMLQLYEYDYDLPSPLGVTGGVSYAIEIYNTTGVSPGTPWAWASASNGNIGLWFSSTPTGGTWNFDPTGGLAFELTGEGAGESIPEPFTAALFAGSVLLGLGRLRRRLS